MQRTAKMVLIIMPFLLGVFLVEQASGGSPLRQAFVFFAVDDGKEIVAVQSNPLSIFDDSGTNDYYLTLTGVNTSTGLGGIPIPGFVSSPGDLTSEVNIYATSGVPEIYWSNHATLYARFELRDAATNLVNIWDTPIVLRTI